MGCGKRSWRDKERCSAASEEEVVGREGFLGLTRQRVGTEHVRERWWWLMCRMAGDGRSRDGWRCQSKMRLMLPSGHVPRGGMGVELVLRATIGKRSGRKDGVMVVRTPRVCGLGRRCSVQRLERKPAKMEMEEEGVVAAAAASQALP